MIYSGLDYFAACLPEESKLSLAVATHRALGLVTSSVEVHALEVFAADPDLRMAATRLRTFMLTNFGTTFIALPKGTSRLASRFLSDNGLTPKITDFEGDAEVVARAYAAQKFPKRAMADMTPAERKQYTTTVKK